MRQCMRQFNAGSTSTETRHREFHARSMHWTDPLIQLPKFSENGAPIPQDAFVVMAEPRCTDCGPVIRSRVRHRSTTLSA